VTRVLKSSGTMHPYHYHLPNTIHWHHLRFAWNITPNYEQPYKRLVEIQYFISTPELQFQLRPHYIQSHLHS